MKTQLLKKPSLSIAIIFLLLMTGTTNAQKCNKGHKCPEGYECVNGVCTRIFYHCQCYQHGYGCATNACRVLCYSICPSFGIKEIKPFDDTSRLATRSNYIYPITVLSPPTEKNSTRFMESADE